MERQATLSGVIDRILRKKENSTTPAVQECKLLPNTPFSGSQIKLPEKLVQANE
ncbi:MAG: hypothetical protein P0Y53_23350 [Candidatus Pseudobacter hemicellulosilyticus]|uniref:Uncharacterized protein n=1 Tax=Candidatus Pseudobacter hemicellulosilyticus TaxID=3121375 RepID=A0AAJ5WQJ1_9BACT|nr:MAG: hypothetical protein P0Y53_23350 [Pseudobacter sp.]